MPDFDIKRVLWRCRRGTKELDLILGKFAESRYQFLDQSLKNQFNKLLEMQDPVLTEWLCLEQEPVKEYKEIVSKILENK